MEERDSESCLHMELGLNLFVIKGEGLLENGHAALSPPSSGSPLAAAQVYVIPGWARTCGPWPHFPAHIALCRSLCSRMVVPGWPSVTILQRVGTHRVPQMLL